jgi:organic radical activating enzyme
MSTKKYFPIKTKTACPFKWNWSTIYLSNADTASCHRTAFSKIDANNFAQFHNTPLKLEDRRRMLDGQWPDENCSYCRKIEELDGTSDRMRQLTIPDMHPSELDSDPTEVVVYPTILEVYFSNACNLGCLYCPPGLSSTITAENVKFGEFNSRGVNLQILKSHYKDLVPEFWKWFPEGFSKLKRLGILGGEPLIQKEFDQLLDMIDQHPNPDCVINIVTNLMVSQEKLELFVSKFRKILTEKKIARIDISCSIDCWGPEQEYVRYGINLEQWESNFKFLMKHKWLYLTINQTISPLTIKTMPGLLIKLAGWRKSRKIGHWFSGVEPGPSYLKAGIFARHVFEKDAEKILALMPVDNNEDQVAYNYMKGILTQICSPEENQEEIIKLITFLDEKDRRRNTNWETLFPWLTEYRKYVV